MKFEVYVNGNLKSRISAVDMDDAVNNWKLQSFMLGLNGKKFVIKEVQ